MYDIEGIKQEILERLRSIHPERVVLFGSRWLKTQDQTDAQFLNGKMNWKMLMISRHSRKFRIPSTKNTAYRQ